MNRAFYRPIEATAVVGDSSKLSNETGWRPRTEFKDLVKEMMEADLEEQKKCL